jgi:hypothetical protein
MCTLAINGRMTRNLVVAPRAPATTVRAVPTPVRYNVIDWSGSYRLINLRAVRVLGLVVLPERISNALVQIVENLPDTTTISVAGDQASSRPRLG